MKKIFITVGSYKEFPRLTDKFFSGSKFIGTTVIIQTPINVFDKEKYYRILKNSDVVISHAGMGNISDLYKFKKKCIIVPRLSFNNEAVDDHQLEICQVLEKYNNNICYSVDNLKIDKAKVLNLPITFFDSSKFIKNITEYIRGDKK